MMPTLVQRSVSLLCMEGTIGTVAGMARAAAIELSEEEDRELRALLRRPSVSQQQALRARIVLRAAEGATNTQIAAEAGVSLPTVGLWRRSFCERRLDGLADAPRSGRPRTTDDDEVQRVLAKRLRSRRMAARIGACAGWLPRPESPRRRCTASLVGFRRRARRRRAGARALQAGAQGAGRRHRQRHLADRHRLGRRAADGRRGGRLPARGADRGK